MLCLMVLCGFPCLSEGETGLRSDVLVLFTSDVHCGVDQNFGYAGLQAIRDAAEASGDHVLLVDDGDSIQGEPIGLMAQGQADIELMNALGYDVTIPGNHEFDYGMEHFLELAEFPYISCNFRRDGELVFDPFVIREFDGMKIAFVGATTPETLHSSTPRYFQDAEGNYIYSFDQGEDGSLFYASVQKAVDDSGAPVRIIRSAETNLGDLCADAVRQITGAEIGLVNGGSVRMGIRKGEIRRDDALSVHPFGARVVMIEATGQQILDALEWGARVVPEESGAFLHCSGMTYEIHSYVESGCTMDDNGMFTGNSGEYRVRNVRVNGAPLEPDRTYTVAGHDYCLIDHGDGQTAFDGAKVLKEYDELDFEVLMHYISDALGGVVGEGYENPYGQERIVAVEAPEA